MIEFSLAGFVIVILILARWAAEQGLGKLNQHHVQQHAATMPEAFAGVMDPPTYARSVEYTLAKGRLSKIEDSYSTVILLLVLFTGLLPSLYHWLIQFWGLTVWSEAAYVMLVGVLLWLPALPFEWYAQFKLEARFGFNTTTPRTWWWDRGKGMLLALLLGYPLLILILKLVDWTGSGWWLWAWGVVMGFQLLMLVLAPLVILPLFNKFSPLPEGSLRDRLLSLGQRTKFPSRNIQVMDGSRRSRHSNAFFTGFGRFRKIVLFDTLIDHLQERELESVLAHEIGHYKKRHIVKMMIWSALGLLLGFGVLAWLAGRPWFYSAFGFEPGRLTPALLLFTLLSGTVTFWLSPLANYWSRRYEYQADRYASTVMQGPQDLIQALRKLNEKNLSNLTPHPLYSKFYYSHPTLWEREKSLRAAPNSTPGNAAVKA